MGKRCIADSLAQGRDGRQAYDDHWLSRPGDRLEREADRVAGEVLQMPERPAAAVVRLRGSSRAHHDLGSGGAPLAESVRAYFEPRFGVDLGDVHVHTDAAAAAAAAAVGARSFTVGRAIGFGRGRYDPVGERGRRLLAHELTHVVQQSGGITGGTGPRVSAHSGPAHVQREVGESEPAQAFSSRTPVQVASLEDLLELLQLPASAVPPGALEDPAVLAGLLRRVPGAAGSVLVPATGLSDSLREQLPDGEVVEIDADTMAAEGGLAADLRTTVRGASRGAGARLVRHGFNPGVKNAIGMVAYPQSRLASGITGTLRGKGARGFLRPAPVLPTTSIVLGHTAIYAKVDGQIIAIRSYASASNLESLAHFAKMTSGREGVGAAIIDHLQPLPKGGGMFDVAGARSMEYPVSAKLALEFSKSLPEGGPLPGELYTAMPDVAAKLGKLRLSNGRNCVHWTVDQLERFIGGKVASASSPGVSLRDVGGADAAVQGKVMGFLTASEGAPVRLPSQRAPTTPVFGRPSRAMRLLRWGGRVFLVWDLGIGVYDVWTAPAEQKVPVALREGGRIGGGLLGAEAGVAACVAFGVETGGLGLLVCGALGAYGGSKVGEAAGELAGNMLTAPIVAMESLVLMMRGLGEAAEITAQMIRGPLEFFARNIVSVYASLDPENWDLRYVPAGVRAVLLDVGYDIWDSFSDVGMDEFLGLAGDPLESFPISGDRMDLLVDEVNAASGESLTAEFFTAMKPHEFVGFWRQRKLHFVMRPDYVAGLEEPGADRARMLFGVRPLVAKRATIDPDNWDVSDVPAIEDDDQPSYFLGEDLITLARIWWSRLGTLDEEDFIREAEAPLSTYQIPLGLLARVAHGVESTARIRFAGTFLEMTSLPMDELYEITKELAPYDFVLFLREYRVGLLFRSDPQRVGEAAAEWVSRGYQPW